MGEEGLGFEAVGEVQALPMSVICQVFRSSPLGMGTSGKQEELEKGGLAGRRNGWTMV